MHNNLPKWVIDQLLSEVQLEHSNIRSLTQDKQNDVNKTAHLLVLPYASSNGEKLIKSMKKSLKYGFPENVTTRVTYSRTRLKILLNCVVGVDLWVVWVASVRG